MPTPARPGAARMRALAADLPNGLVAGFRAGREIALPNGGERAPLYAVGMGGSAIAADFARGLIDAECPLALTVVRAPSYPGALDRRSRVILLSYSGDTAETVAAYGVAGRAGAHRVVVTSGGTLAERADADGVPVLRVPPGLPARAAIGPLLGGLLGLLDPIFPESNEERVARAAEATRAEIGQFVRPGSAAARIARAIGPRLPWIYAEHGFAAVARRWATQIEENAKRLAGHDEAPELFHNAVAAWSALRRAEAARHAAVLVEWSQEPPSVRRGFAALSALLGRVGAAAIRVPLDSDDRLAAMLTGIALGDQVSLRLAEAGGTDPSRIEAIDRMRATLAEGDRPGAPDGVERSAPPVAALPPRPARPRPAR